ncbi:MAG: PTS sugar transporter subunit IIA [Betaproteobacteria bacterium]
MNRIAELLPRSNVAVGADAATKRDLFGTIADLFASSGDLARSSVVDALSAREKLGSTGLGQGIAIPHGRIKGLRDARGAFVRLTQPIPFDAPDGRPVGQVFVLLVPEHATEQHLELLSELAQMFSERAFRERLAVAPDATAAWNAIRGWAPAA